MQTVYAVLAIITIENGTNAIGNIEGTFSNKEKAFALCNKLNAKRHERNEELDIDVIQYVVTPLEIQE